jgi:hypothetical protein
MTSSSLKTKKSSRDGKIITKRRNLNVSILSNS